MPRRLHTVLRRALHLLARPTAGARGAVAIQPFRGYGSRSEVFVIGRVFRQRPRRGHRTPLGQDLADIGRRLFRRGLPGARVRARFGDREQVVHTDADGYFRIHLQLAAPPASGRTWHTMDLALPGDQARTGAEVFVPPATARRVVISDIDDTVMFTGVADKVRMLWRLFVQGPHSRVAFPGVAALYRALHAGPGGDERNPMLYVSRGPWGLYELLDAFFNLHDIPVGPILFLREWGLKPTRPLPRRAAGHKLALIRNMLALYHDLPFVLIGDSGQRDPEIYARVVHEHPGRVQAIYIRNVGHDPTRRRAIEVLAKEVAAAGSTLLLAADSFAMAEHAATHGLLGADALRQVTAERVGDEPHHATRRVDADGVRSVEDAVGAAADDEHPNVALETRRGEREH